MSSVAGAEVSSSLAPEVAAPPRRLTARRRRSRRRVAIIAVRIAILVGFLAAWEWLAGPRDQRGTVIDEFYVSQPSAIWDALWRWIDSGELALHLSVTIQETVAGFVIGSAIGIFVGFAMATSRLLDDIFRPFVSALYSIPRTALVPLFILWFGLGNASKIAVVASVVCFLVFYNTYAGVKDVDRQLIDTMRLMGAGRWQLHSKTTLPSAMSWIIAGLHISAPYALVVAVMGEMLASNRGMGYLIIRSSSQFFTPGVFAGVLVLMLVGVTLSGLLTLFERRVLRWKPAAGH